MKPHLKEKRTLIYPSAVLKPEDWLRFVQFDSFLSHWESLGLDDNDLRHLEMSIMVAPSAAPIVPGTGGLRKMRFAPRSWNVGKRGAVRVCYVYFEEYAVVTLMVAYAKNRKDNLTPAEKGYIKTLISEIEAILGKERN